jgi:hypothetical protein
MGTTEKDAMTAEFDEQLSDDLAKQAEAQASTQWVWDEGFYLAQYEKQTTFKSELAEFTRKDGTGTFPNVLYDVPVGMFKFKLLGFAGRKGDPIIEWDAPKGFTFRAAFRSVERAPGKLTDESVNGGLLQACAASNGFAGKAMKDLLEWYENNMVVIHIGLMKANPTKGYAARNTIRAIRPHNG